MNTKTTDEGFINSAVLCSGQRRKCSPHAAPRQDAGGVQDAGGGEAAHAQGDA